MKTHFSIEYKTQWGEELRVQITKVGKDGKKKYVDEYPLSTENGEIWEGDIDIALSNTAEIEYKYALYDNGTLVWTEWEVAPHRLLLDGITNNYIITDRWRPIPDDLPLFSSAYTECMGATADGKEAIDTMFSSTLQLRVVEPRLRKGEYLAICGSTPQLGEWQKPRRLSMIALQEWGVNIDADLLFDEAEYKYVIVNANNEIMRWEEGANRRISTPKLDAKQMWVKTDEQPRLSFGNWKIAGVVIPVFSIRTDKSFGIGDFGDFKTLIQWAVRTKMHAIQVLPINDTIKTGSWEDSYPYNAISIFALNPLYCDLNALPRLNDRLMMEKFMMKQQELNALWQIDYEQVIKYKMEYLRLIFAQEGKEVMASEGFKKYFEANKDWLVPYAAYCYLRDRFHTAAYKDWPAYSVYKKKEIDKLSAPDSPEYDEIALSYYIQYKLHIQLLEVRNAARENGIIIKGDIPIGISRESVEAWAEPHLFNLDGQAGAPPDDFAVNGQNWGFPTYNWDAMAADGYKWWTRRFQKLAEYFDAYRIDHVLGFFRIWEIPMHSVHGLLGQFSPSLPMSVDEIESYGMRFNAELMSRPYITDETLKAIFDYRDELVKTLYLNKRPDGRYDLKPEYGSQQRIREAFAGKNDEDNVSMREGLYSLASCVLFVPDTKDCTKFHPRISAQHDFMYKSLLQHEKEAFDRLYEEYFYHRHNKFWYKEAMKKLPVLTQCTRMLVCAEDLGMVPECVSWVMNNMRILSLEIQTMPKAMFQQFGHLWENPYRSVATISTHDMCPLRMWWDEDEERAQQFYNNALYKDGQAPHPAPGWLCEDVVSAHLFCPSALCLLSFQDLISIDENLRYPDANAERINIPANPRHYWRYRMHISVEQLLKENDYNDHLASLIENSGRA